MTRPEKVVLLGLFMEHGLVEATGEVLKRKCLEVADLMRVANSVRSSTKSKITGRHVETYRRNYSLPILAKGGEGMQYLRDEDKKPILDEEGHPLLDKFVISTKDQERPGTMLYWKRLCAFDRLVRESLANSDDSADKARKRIQTERIDKNNKAAQKRDQYAAARLEAQRKKRRF